MPGCGSRPWGESLEALYADLMMRSFPLMCGLVGEVGVIVGQQMYCLSASV
jgi:hypothetical protein